jgi:hypothetical protein
MNVGDLFDAPVLGPDGAAVGTVVDMRFALEIPDDGDGDGDPGGDRDREQERPLSEHVAGDAVGRARLVGLLVDPRGGGSLLGYERTGVDAPWPVAQLVRRRHRGTFLVRWDDVAELADPGARGAPVTVRLRAGYERRSPEL